MMNDELGVVKDESFLISDTFFSIPLNIGRTDIFESWYTEGA